MFKTERVTFPSRPSVSLREISAADFDGGFLSLLNKLTEVRESEISRDAFEERIRSLRPSKFILVAVEGSGRVVGTAAVFLEPKLQRGLGHVGHIEDVVVDEAYRGSSLGRVLIDRVVRYATGEGPRKCFKVILDCNEKNTGFYERCGFHRAEVCMRIDAKL